MQCLTEGKFAMQCSITTQLIVSQEIKFSVEGEVFHGLHRNEGSLLPMTNL